MLSGYLRDRDSVPLQVITLAKDDIAQIAHVMPHLALAPEERIQ